jgi:hypothetical protein
MQIVIDKSAQLEQEQRDDVIGALSRHACRETWQATRERFLTTLGTRVTQGN